MLDNFPLKKSTFYLPYNETAESIIEDIGGLAPTALKSKAAEQARRFIHADTPEQKAAAQTVLAVLIPAAYSQDLDLLLHSAAFESTGGAEYDQVLSALVALAPACLAKETKQIVLELLDLQHKAGTPESDAITYKLAELHKLIPYALHAQRHKLLTRLIDIKNKAAGFAPATRRRRATAAPRKPATRTRKTAQEVKADV